MKTESLARKYLYIVGVILVVTFLSVQLIELSFQRSISGSQPLGEPQGHSDIQRVALEDQIHTLDPVLISGVGERWLSELIYDSLFEMDPETGQRTSQLVRDISGSDSQIIVELDSERIFHSGRPVTAWDVKFSLERFARLSAQYGLGHEGQLRGLQGLQDYLTGQAQEITGIEITGNRTLTFHLDSVDPQFLDRLSLLQMAILEERLVSGAEPYGLYENQQETLTINGTGRVRLAEWSYQALALERAPGTVSAFPLRMEILVATRPQEALLDLEMLRADGALFSSNPAEALAYALPEQADRVEAHPTGHIFFLRFTPQVNQSLRRGLSFSLNREELARVSGYLPVQGLLPATMADNQTVFEENASLAGLYLQEARGRNLTLGYVDGPVTQSLVDALATQWEPWEIAVEQVAYEHWWTLQSALQSGQVDLALDQMNVGRHLPEKGLYRASAETGQLEILEQEQEQPVLTGNGRGWVGLLQQQYWSLSADEDADLYGLQSWMDSLARQGF